MQSVFRHRFLHCCTGDGTASWNSCCLANLAVGIGNQGLRGPGVTRDLGTSDEVQVQMEFKMVGDGFAVSRIPDPIRRWKRWAGLEALGIWGRTDAMPRQYLLPVAHILRRHWDPTRFMNPHLGNGNSVCGACLLIHFGCVGGTGNSIFERLNSEMSSAKLQTDSF